MTVYNTISKLSSRSIVNLNGLTLSTLEISYKENKISYNYKINKPLICYQIKNVKVLDKHTNTIKTLRKYTNTIKELAQYTNTIKALTQHINKIEI